MSRPNVLVLLLDTTRFDHLSCYGYERNTTPFIDSLAEDGIQYENAYSTSIWSLPAYASLFTGKLPSEHGAIDWNRQIEKNTLVETFGSNGYTTAVISPHLVLGEFGIQEAFDRSRQVSVRSRDLPFDDDPIADRVRKKMQSDGWNSTLRKIADIGSWTIEERSLRTIPNGIAHLSGSVKQSLGIWSDDGAETVVEETKETVDSLQEPYFMFANFIEPHAPYKPPRGYIREHLKGDVSLDEINNVLETYSMTTDVILGDSTLNEHERDILHALFDGELTYLDEKIAELVSHVSDQPNKDPPIVVLLSDHGDLFGEWGLWGHQAKIHNNLCKVPLIVSHPEIDSKTIDDSVSLRGVFDYLVEIAGGDDSAVSATIPHETPIVEYYGWDTQKLGTPWENFPEADAEDWEAYQVSVIEEGYRLLWDATGEVRLYNLKRDSDEQQNVASKNPQIVEELKQVADDAVGRPEENHNCYRNRSDATTDIEKPNPSVISKLENLGYK